MLHLRVCVCAAPSGPKSCGIVYNSRTLLRQHYKRMLLPAASKVMLLATSAAFAGVPALQITEKRQGPSLGISSPALFGAHRRLSHLALGGLVTRCTSTDSMDLGG